MINFIKKKNKNSSHGVIITDKVYNNNLQFYTIMKLLLKCGFSDKQLILFQDTLLKNKDSKDREKIVSILLSNDVIVAEGTQKYEDLCLLVNTIEHCEIAMWISLLDVAIELMLVKGLILEESKAYVKEQFKDLIRNIDDKLSLEYDMSNLNLPYGQRVISSLLVYTLSNTDRESEFSLKSSGKIVKAFNEKLKIIVDNYFINCNNMFSLIMTESMNQSITSDAGQSYESRVSEKLTPIVDKLSGHSHDSKIPSVEYDFTFEINGKSCGISAKRTLRERYKQNFEDVESLDVDYMFLFTLGIDLNEDKLNNILQKNGIFVVVSNEIYESKEYLKNNKRVLSSKNLSRQLLTKVTSLKMLSNEELKEIRG